MIVYMKLGRVRGLSIELNHNFGLTPLFRKNTFHHETIVDIPYAQITYTSGRWTPKRRTSTCIKKIPIRSASNVNEENDQTTECSRRVNDR